jgi:predicted PurR-regulated permease PerM
MSKFAKSLLVMNFAEKPYTFDRVVRILISIAIVIGLYLLVKSISGALLPFLIGWLLAYLINPLVEFCQNKLRIKNRGLSIGVALTATAGVIVGLFYALWPYITNELSHFVEIMDYFRNEAGQIRILPSAWVDFINQHIDFDEIARNLTRGDIEDILNRAGTWVGRVFSGSVSVLGWVWVVFLVLLYMVFILIDFDKIVRGFPELLPPKYKNTVLMVLHDLKVAMNRYFRGQALVVLCVTVLYSTGFALIGLPLGILLGIFIGILNFIPYLQILGYIPALLLCALKAVATGGNFGWIALSAAIVFGVVQVIQDGFIVPKIQGKMSGMNPALILLSLSVWGLLLGFLGLIIAIPLTSLLMSYYDRVIIKEKELYQAPSDDNSEK